MAKRKLTTSLTPAAIVSSSNEFFEISRYDISLYVATKFRRDNQNSIERRTVTELDKHIFFYLFSKH